MVSAPLTHLRCLGEKKPALHFGNLTHFFFLVEYIFLNGHLHRRFLNCMSVHFMHFSFFMDQPYYYFVAHLARMHFFFVLLNLKPLEQTHVLVLLLNFLLPVHLIGATTLMGDETTSTLVSF